MKLFVSKNLYLWLYNHNLKDQHVPGRLAFEPVTDTIKLTNSFLTLCVALNLYLCNKSWQLNDGKSLTGVLKM